MLAIYTKQKIMQTKNATNYRQPTVSSVHFFCSLRKSIEINYLKISRVQSTGLWSGERQRILRTGKLQNKLAVIQNRYR